MLFYFQQHRLPRSCQQGHLRAFRCPFLAVPASQPSAAVHRYAQLNFTASISWSPFVESLRQWISDYYHLSVVAFEPSSTWEHSWSVLDCLGSAMWKNNGNLAVKAWSTRPKPISIFLDWTPVYAQKPACQSCMSLVKLQGLNFLYSLLINHYQWSTVLIFRQTLKFWCGFTWIFTIKTWGGWIGPRIALMIHIRPWSCCQWDPWWCQCPRIWHFGVKVVCFFCGRWGRGWLLLIGSSHGWNMIFSTYRWKLWMGRDLAKRGNSNSLADELVNQQLSQIRRIYRTSSDLVLLHDWKSP